MAKARLTEASKQRTRSPLPRRFPNLTPPNRHETPSYCRLRNEEHSRLQEMRLQHAEDVDKATRRRAATLASLTRQAELDREDWARRAKEGASAGGEEVGMWQRPESVVCCVSLSLWLTISLFRPSVALGRLYSAAGRSCRSIVEKSMSYWPRNGAALTQPAQYSHPKDTHGLYPCVRLHVLQGESHARRLCRTAPSRFGL